MPAITADAAVLMDAGTGRVYFAKKPYKRRAPASLTKIMTAVVALEYGRLDAVANVSRNAAYTETGSIIDLRAGEKITLENLLQAALIMSANDSTVAIAELVGGMESRFIQMMNAKALLLGALHTRFANTNGYSDPGHYSTARDLALITRYALQNPVFNRLVGTREATVCFYGSKRREKIANTNRLLRNNSYPGIDGVKTGSTPLAGNCLIASATRDGRRLIAVVLHSADRYRDAVALLEYGFTGVKPVTLCRRGEPLASQKVHDGLEAQVPLVCDRTVTVDLAAEQTGMISREIKLGPVPEAPVRTGQKTGEVVFRLAGEELVRVELVAQKDVPRRTWLNRVKKRMFSRVTQAVLLH
ncbi:D-alanyl-D-alanine carboxypeptidase family protein [Desulfotomaculum copahuensis]|uniref:D-alanyl-D-alanine carboxypeptidase family protein n=1 Tax=Desulfotomaculum copahuensis TaxID=1838280 RepID=UPI001FA6DC00|nr:D-alanyl-D-alanine carboxypeptidase family protein [Desulfotomaculum copahuensis]